jgi:hypothetical protein
MTPCHSSAIENGWPAGLGPEGTPFKNDFNEWILSPRTTEINDGVAE